MSTIKASSEIAVSESMPEMLLWRAVIARAIQEWISGSLGRQREAEQYLFEDNRDFLVVCGCAGMDVGRLRSRLAHLRAQAVPGSILVVTA
jgi:hypothetical protein